MVCAVLVVLVLAFVPDMATAAENLYRAQSIVTGQGETNRIIGFAASLEDVLIKVSGALQKVAKKTYIRLPKFPQPAFDQALADCKSDKSWTTFELPDVGHMAMLDAPDRVSELILQAA